MTAIHNEFWISENIETGMEIVPFSRELLSRSLNVAVMERVLPGWVYQIGDPSHPIIYTFRNFLSPIVGLRIELDGSVLKVPITEGPLADKALE